MRLFSGAAICLLFVVGCGEKPEDVAVRDAQTFVVFSGDELGAADRCAADVSFAKSGGLVGERAWRATATFVRRLDKARAKEARVSGDQAVVVLTVTRPVIPNSRVMDFMRDETLLETVDTESSERVVPLKRERGRWVVCEDLEEKEKQRLKEADREEVKRLRETAVGQGLTLSGESVDEVRSSLCSQLAAALPPPRGRIVRGPDDTRRDEVKKQLAASCPRQTWTGPGEP